MLTMHYGAVKGTMHEMDIKNPMQNEGGAR
jgi:hypothetical protein